ncbi:hypothetical protein [Streptomyces sp. NPDC003720]|uniref:hypothetical protein n=1 Tax=Streptomyces sp. NPDC003720 TaxID=3364684 RepID=UPI0036B0F09E
MNLQPVAAWLYSMVALFGPGLLLVFGPLLLWALVLWLGRLPRRLRARRLDRQLCPVIRARYIQKGDQP